MYTPNPGGNLLIPAAWIAIAMMGLSSTASLAAQTTYNEAVVGYAYGSPSGTLQFDNLHSRSGSDIDLVRLGTGYYRYRFHNVSTTGRYVPQIGWPLTGSSPHEPYCSIDSYGLGFPPADFRFVRVLCLDDDGNPKDRWNQVLLLDEGSAGGDNHHIAFLDSREAVPVGDTLDLTSFAYNPGGGSTTLHRTGTGAYEIRMDGLGAIMHTGVTVQVTPYSDIPRHCRIHSYTLNFAGSDNARFRVRCRNFHFDANSRFALLIASTEPDASGPASVYFSGGTEPNWTKLTGDQVHNPHGSVQYRWDGSRYNVRFEWPTNGNLGVAVSSWRNSGSWGYRACGNSSPHRPPGESENYLYINVRCTNFDGEAHPGPFTLLLTEVSSIPQGDMIFADRFEQ